MALGAVFARGRRPSLFDVVTAGLRSPATLGLIALTVAVFALEVGFADGRPAEFADPVWRSLAGWVPYLNQGQWWRLVTDQLLHQSWWHLADNMELLYVFGPLVEAIYGWPWLLALYFTSGAAGVLATIGVVHTLGVFGGASVAVFGIHGAVLVIAVRRVRRPWMWTYLAAAATSVAVQWHPWTFDNFMRNQVHLYGLLAGAFVAAGYEVATTQGAGPRTRVATSAGIIAAAGVIAGVGWPRAS